MGRVELRPTSGKKDDAAGGVDKYYIRLGLDPGKYRLVAAPLASGWSKYEYLQRGWEFTFNRGQETYLGQRDMARSLQGELNLHPLGFLPAGGSAQKRNLTEDRLDVVVIDNFDEDIPVFRVQYGLSGRALVQKALFPKWSRTACEEQYVYGSEIHGADSQTYRNSLSVSREFAIAAGVITCVAIVGMGLSGGGMTAPLGGASVIP